MANTTNFGWETPDDTDLVKDGAAAMRTLGNAIDTSFVDLKGGTTGQMLTKASNTDLDYSWVTPQIGDITAITATSPLTGGGTTGDVTVGIQDGTTSQKGAVQLEDSTSSTSTTKAATPNSVKSAYDLANNSGSYLIYSGSFSGATTHTFDSVFDTTYDNYKIIVDITSTSGADTDIGIGLRKSGVGSVNFDSSTYSLQYSGTISAGTSGTGLLSTAASAYPSLCSFVTELISPFIAVNTMAMSQGHGINSAGQPRRFTAAAYKYNTDQYFGFLIQSSSGNIGGKIRIYGYKN